MARIIPPQEDLTPQTGTIDPGVAAQPGLSGVGLGKTVSGIGSYLMDEGARGIAQGAQSFKSLVGIFAGGGKGTTKEEKDSSQTSDKKKKRQFIPEGTIPGQFAKGGAGQDYQDNQLNAGLYSDYPSHPGENYTNDLTANNMYISESERNDMADIAKERTAARLKKEGNIEPQQALDTYQYSRQVGAQTGAYSNAMANAISYFNQLMQQRLQQTQAAVAGQQVLDETGKPVEPGSLPKDVGTMAAAAKEAVANQLTDPQVATSFDQNFNAFVQQKQTSAESIARQQIHQHTLNSVGQASASFMEQAKLATDPNEVAFYYDQHKQILDNVEQAGIISPIQRKQQEVAFNDQVQTARWRQAIETNPHVALQRLNNQQPVVIDSDQPGDVTYTDPDQVGYNAIHIGAADRAKYIEEAKSQIALNDRKQSDAEKAMDSQVVKLYGEANKAIESGGKVPGETMDILANYAIGTRFEKPVENLLNKQERLSAFSQLSQPEREAVVEQLKVTTSPLAAEQVKLFKKVNDNLSEQENNNLVGLAQSQKILPEMPPLNVEGNISRQLQARQPVISYLEKHYGKETSGISSTELDDLQRKIDSSSIADKTKVYNDIITGLGSDSIKLFGQMYRSGNVMGAFAGQLYSTGQAKTAQQIFEGQELRKQDSKTYGFKKKDESGADIDLNTSIDYFIPKQQKDTIEAAKNVYASLTASDKDTSGEFNKDRWETALNSVTNGEPIDVGKFASKNYVEAPKLNMSASDFNAWRESLTPRDIDLMGGIHGVDSSTGVDLVSNAQLVQYGKGRYLVQIRRYGEATYLMNQASGGAEPFVLDYSRWENKTDLSDGPQTIDPVKVQDFTQSITSHPDWMNNQVPSLPSEKDALTNEQQSDKLTEEAVQNGPIVNYGYSANQEIAKPQIPININSTESSIADAKVELAKAKASKNKDRIGKAQVALAKVQSQLTKLKLSNKEVDGDV